jgi:hypothetical protein
VRNEKDALAHMQPYINVVNELKKAFHEMYERGKQDGTLNTEISEEEMFSSSFHIMLAAVTRYAIGLIYISEKTNPEKEVERLEKMILREFTREK